ncbi:MAG TPA: hypothetical protein VJ959_05015 [Desulfotignum sp.]|nr:hypothetical protein [Desulfotignum sp.]
MEKDRLINNTMAGLTNLSGLPSLADSKKRYANDSVYPEADELANALCLLNLIICRKRSRTGEPSGRSEMKLMPEGTGYADV